MTTAELENNPQTPARLRIASPLRWLMALGVLAGVMVLILAAPPEIQPLVLALLLVSTVCSLVLVWQRERVAALMLNSSLYTMPGLPGIVRGLSILALVLMCLTAYAMRPRPNSEAATGIPILIFGLIVTGIAFGLSHYLRPRPVRTREPLYRHVERLRDAIANGTFSLKRLAMRVWQDDAQARPIRWKAVIIGSGMVLAVMQSNVLTEDNAIFFLRWMLDFSEHLQLILLVGGSTLVAWGLAGRPVNRKAAPEVTEAPSFRGYGREIKALLGNRHVQLLLLVLAIAAFARLWDLELWTTRFLDELHYMNAISRLQTTGNQQIITPFSEVTAFTWMYPYMQAAATLLTGPSFSGVRLVSALFGIAEVAAVYMLGRQVFDRRTGLFAALVLATLPVHVHFSRIGINNIADPLFGILTLAFLARGLRSGKQGDFALAGLFLGWTQYFYEGGRLFYPLFTVCWLGWLFLFMRRGGKFRFPTPRNLVVFAVAALVLILPVYYIITSRAINPAPRFTEMRDAYQAQNLDDQALSFQARVQPIIEKIQLPLRALVEQPDLSWFYGAHVGYVMPVLVPLFFIGLCLCLFMLRTPGGSLVLWWIAGASAGIALISDSLSSPRYLVMMPAVALGLALGITGLLKLLTARRELPGEADKPAPLPRRQLLILGLMALLVTVSQGGFYAFDLVPNFYLDRVYSIIDDRGKHFTDTDDALLRSVALPPNTDVFIVSRNLIWGFNSTTVPMYWRRPDLTIQHVFRTALNLNRLRVLPRDRNYVFFLEPGDTATLTRIQKFFKLSDDPTLNGVYSPYRIPRDAQLIQYFAAASDNKMLPELAATPTPGRAIDGIEDINE